MKAIEEKENERLRNVEEIAFYLGISVSGVRKLVREKRIPYCKVLNRIKFDINKVNLWLEKSEKEENKFSILLGI